MKFRLPRALALVAATTVATAGLTLLAGPASAAVVGTLAINPATGFDDSALSFETSGPCPAGTNIVVRIEGAGFPSGGTNVVGNISISALPTNAAGGYVVPITQTLREYAAQQTPPATLAGQYGFTLVCRTSLNPASLGDFTGSITFTSPTTYESVGGPVDQDTTTTLTASPAGPVTEGTPVTLTATVAPAGATGTVQFSDGGTAIGSPVAVSGGTATLSTSALPVGTRSLTAAFVGGSGFNDSTSAAVSLVVQAAPPGAEATTTALAVTPGGTAQEGTPVTLTATVAPAAAAGTVTFRNGGTAIGAAVPVSGGTATLSTSALTPGAYSLTAQFTPADAAAFQPSVSVNVAFTVTATPPPAGSATDTQIIRTTISAGALTITSDDAPVILPEPQFDETTGYLATAGEINPVTVIDTRAGNPGWNVSGQVTDFSNGAGGTIDGRNLGWDPEILSALPSQTVTAGPVVAAAPAVEPGAPADAAAGLKTSRTLGTAADDGGRGTAVLGADLTLKVPTSAEAGTYDATLTLTAI